ncbi:MAG: TIGR03745 family integrating conjugative element membrane protein [bacterium]|nr:TIGR03745 family integrating conjugative element membrane protein [bacterium]
MSTLSRIRLFFVRFRLWLVNLCVWAVGFNLPLLNAALPVQTAPTTVSAAAGDWLNLILGYIADAGKVLGLAVAVFGFLYVAWSGFAKFNEARRGRAEWGEVVVIGVVGAVLLLLAGFLLTEAANTITTAIT